MMKHVQCDIPLLVSVLVSMLIPIISVKNLMAFYCSTTLHMFDNLFQMAINDTCAYGISNVVKKNPHSKR